MLIPSNLTQHVTHSELTIRLKNLYQGWLETAFAAKTDYITT